MIKIFVFFAHGKLAVVLKKNHDLLIQVSSMSLLLPSTGIGHFISTAVFV